MANSTKRILSMTLKKLLVRTSLDNITVAQLAEEAEISRKTFYYHFHDLYDLVEWIMKEDGRYLLTQALREGDWNQGLLNLFDYLQENKPLILNLCNGVDRGTLEKWLVQYLKPLLRFIFENKLETRHLRESDIEFVCSLYAYGLTGMFLNWISEGMLTDPGPMLVQVCRFVGGNPEELLRHYLNLTDNPHL